MDDCFQSEGSAGGGGGVGYSIGLKGGVDTLY